MGRQLGLFNELKIQKDESIPKEAQELIDERLKAKQNKDFKASDVIRDRLLNEFGLIIEDTPEGTRWKKA